MFHFTGDWFFVLHLFGILQVLSGRSQCSASSTVRQQDSQAIPLGMSTGRLGDIEDVAKLGRCERWCSLDRWHGTSLNNDFFGIDSETNAGSVFFKTTTAPALEFSEKLHAKLVPLSGRLYRSIRRCWPFGHRWSTREINDAYSLCVMVMVSPRVVSLRVVCDGKQLIAVQQFNGVS